MPDLTERLQLVVDATTDTAETKFRKLTGAAEDTATSAVKAANAVTSSAERTAAARLREQDAVGKLRVAEIQLEELRDKGNAKASQLAAAEERVANAQRTLAVTTNATTRAVTEQADAQTRLERELAQTATAANSAERQIRQVGDASDSAERSSGRLGSSLGGSLRVGVGLLAGAGIVQGLRSLADAAAESARIGARTANVIQTTGEAAGVSADQVGDLATAISNKTGVDDEAIQSGQNLLLTFTNVRNEAGLGNAVFDRASQAIVDMSAAMGTDASASALQLGKALNDPIGGISALSRAGVSFTEQQKDQIRTLQQSGDILGAQRIILDELAKEFGGAAAAMGTPLDRARVAVGNFAEQLGGYLLPAIGDGADALTNDLLPAADKIGPSLGRIADSVVDMLPQLVRMAEQGVELGQDVLPLLTGSLSLLLSAADLLGPVLPPIAVGLAAIKVAGLASTGVTALSGAMEGLEGKAGAAGRGLSNVAGALPLVGAAIGLTVFAIGQGTQHMEAFEQQASALFRQLSEGGKSADQAGQALQRMDQFATALGDNRVLGVGADFSESFDAAAQSARDYWDSLTPVEQASQKVTQYTNDLAVALATGGAKSEEYRTAQERLAYWTQLQSDRQGQLAIATGQVGDVQAQATAATDALTASIESGQTTGEAYNGLVRQAAEAQTAASAATDLTNASIAAYNAVTRDAVDTTLGLIDAQLSRNDATYGFLNAMDAANSAIDDQTTSVDEVAQAQDRLQAAALNAASAAADAAVAAATANGTVLTDLQEQQIRASATIDDLRARLNTPGLSDGAKAAIQGVIDQLVTAQGKSDIKATVTTVGAEESKSKIDTATKDRTSTVTVQQVGGEKVSSYLEGIASTDRLAIIRVESRNGPAVAGYLDGIAGAYRLAIINVETRGGPAVERYLDSLAATRTAIIQVRQQAVGAPVTPGGPGVAQLRGAPAGAVAGRYGDGGLTVGTLSVTVQSDGSGRITQQSLVEGGKQVVRQLQAYRRANGSVPGIVQ